MAKDVDLLAKNAKTYNEPGSQVFKVEIWAEIIIIYCIPALVFSSMCCI